MRLALHYKVERYALRREAVSHNNYSRRVKIVIINSHDFSTDMEITAIDASRLRVPAQESMLDPTLCNVDLPFKEVFFPLGFALEIRTNDPIVLTAAAESWDGWGSLRNAPALHLDIIITDGGSEECPPSPVARTRRHLFCVTADLHHHLACDLKAGFGFACFTQAALRHGDYLRYHFLESAAYSMICALYVTPLHAACVSRNGHGMLLCGDSGAGKSTLAYACARAGWIYTSDDASYLLRSRNQPRVIGNSRKIRFRPSAHELFPELDGRSLTPRAEGKPSIEVPTCELAGIATKDETAIHSIVFLKRGSSEITELVPLYEDEALGHFQQINYSQEIRDQLLGSLHALAVTPVYELRYRDLAPAIECLNRLTAEGVQTLDWRDIDV
jgi:hypothetical protein